MPEKPLPFIFSPSPDAPASRGLAPKPGDELCSGLRSSAGYARWSYRCDLRVKDVYTPEVHAELRALADSLDEFDVRRFGLDTAERSYLGLGFCGRHSPERILRNNVAVRREQNERYAAQEAARKAERSREEALQFRVETALGRPIGGYGVSVDKYGTGVTIPLSVLNDLLTRVEAQA